MQGLQARNLSALGRIFMRVTDKVCKDLTHTNTVCPDRGKLGRQADAAAQYRAVLAQWKDADKALVGEYVRQAEQCLARTTGAG